MAFGLNIVNDNNITQITNNEHVLSINSIATLRRKTDPGGYQPSEPGGLPFYRAIDIPAEWVADGGMIFMSPLNDPLDDPDGHDVDSLMFTYPELTRNQTFDTITVVPFGPSVQFSLVNIRKNVPIQNTDHVFLQSGDSMSYTSATPNSVGFQVFSETGVETFNSSFPIFSIAQLITIVVDASTQDHYIDIPISLGIHTGKAPYFNVGNWRSWAVYTGTGNDFAHFEYWCYWFPLSNVLRVTIERAINITTSSTLQKNPTLTFKIPIGVIV